MKAHFSDKYVLQAKKNRLYSRAWFKIDEIQKKYKIFSNNIGIIDLGASPGGWSYYASKYIGSNGFVIACDTSPMNNICGVKHLKLDMKNIDSVNKIINFVDIKKIKVILSDMSPNISGISEIDIPKSIYLAEIALNCCKNILQPNGNFVVKIFQGSGFKKYVNKVTSIFRVINIYKPNASRSSSKEIYIIAMGKL